MSISKNFKSKRIFRIWFYAVSHSTLILRSEKQYFDVDYNIKYDDPNTTIDIILKGVDFISIPNRFDGIEVQKEGNKYIFNKNDNWVIVAYSCVVGKTDGDDEDRIWDMSLKYDEIIELY
jgi:hypothetical protein